MTLQQLQENMREAWDNLHKNRTTPPSRKETHALSDATLTEAYEAGRESERERVATIIGKGKITTQPLVFYKEKDEGEDDFVKRIINGTLGYLLQALRE
jgi:hypothetical protein